MNSEQLFPRHYSLTKLSLNFQQRANLQIRELLKTPFRNEVRNSSKYASFEKTRIKISNAISVVYFYNPNWLINFACIPLLRESFFIVSFVFSNCFINLFTSATLVPEPLAIRLRREGPIIK